MEPKTLVILALLVLSVFVDFTTKFISIASDALILGIAVWFWKPWKKSE